MKWLRLLCRCRSWHAVRIVGNYALATDPYLARLAHYPTVENLDVRS